MRRCQKAERQMQKLEIEIDELEADLAAELTDKQTQERDISEAQLAIERHRQIMDKFIENLQGWLDTDRKKLARFTTLLKRRQQMLAKAKAAGRTDAIAKLEAIVTERQNFVNLFTTRVADTEADIDKATAEREAGPSDEDAE